MKEGKPEYSLDLARARELESRYVHFSEALKQKYAERTLLEDELATFTEKNKDWYEKKSQLEKISQDVALTEARRNKAQTALDALNKEIEENLANTGGPVN